MKVEALLCSCNDMKMKTKPIKRPVGCYNGRRKSSSRKGHSGVPRGGWLGAVRKKLMLKTHNKNIIIIHNNTSITSNDDDIRPSSSVDPPKDLHIPSPPVQLQEGKTDDLLLKPEVDVVAVADPDPDPSPAPALAPAPAPAPAPAVIIKEGGENYSLSLKQSNDIASTGDQQDMLKPLIPDYVASSVVDEKKLTLAHQVVVHVTQRLTNDVVDDKEAMAAITIQTTFRSHLARRAFKALKSLVRLQAVVRGVVVRRQARMALHCMRALLRLGDRVRTRHLLTYQS